VALEQIGSKQAGSGVPFLLAAGIMYEVIAASCSSPQTTEINASTRADTLMKWVNIGIAQGALFVAAAAIFDPTHAKAYLGGGGLAAAIMYLSYHHAKVSGLSNAGPSTEG
jgi:hypothetical protein